MSAILRLALALGVGLLAAGTVVTPHEPAWGWTHQALDHPPSALHSALIAHALHLATSPQAGLAGATVAVAAPAPGAVALSVTTLALLAFATVRPWRPRALGALLPAVALAAPQSALAPKDPPPRPSFSS